MEEAGWLLLLVIAVVSFALLLTYLVDKQTANDVAHVADNTMYNNNNEVEEEMNSDNNSKQEAANDGGWKCACEGGGIFLPPSLMRSVGGPSAFMRAGAGNCYHKQM